MKRYIIMLLCIPFLFSGCLRDLEKEGIKNETIYKGRVVDAKNKPLNGIMVRITNGNLIYNSVSTGEDGIFQISIDITKIDNTYYIQIGEEGSLVKRSSLKGFGQDVYDYGDIPFVDVKLPNVETIGITAMSTNSFSCKCNVKSPGASIVTERGVCWSTNIPTVDDNVVPMGSGEGIYSCIISGPSINIRTTTYYVRAYAKNEQGYGYGDPIEINSSKLEYFSLPAIEFGGYTYHVHPDLGSMQWSQGNTACLGLDVYGYDDWFLPNKEELLSIAEQTNTLNIEHIYWSSSLPRESNTEHLAVYYDENYGWSSSSRNPNVGEWLSDDRYMFRIIPVRKDR